jgi:hypothetical protein
VDEVVADVGEAIDPKWQNSHPQILADTSDPRCAAVSAFRGQTAREGYLRRRPRPSRVFGTIVAIIVAVAVTAGRRNIEFEQACRLWIRPGAAPAAAGPWSPDADVAVDP